MSDRFFMLYTVDVHISPAGFATDSDLASNANDQKNISAAGVILFHLRAVSGV